MSTRTRPSRHPALTFFFASTCLLAATTAHAEGHTSLSLPPLRPFPVDAPGPEPEELTRRAHEISADALLSAVGCAGRAPSDLATPDPCASLSARAGLEARYLHRLHPHAGIGAKLGAARFGWDAARALGDGAQSTGALWWGASVVARGYLFDEARVDPYLEASIGAGFVRMGAKVPSGPVELSRAGLAFGARLGLDVFASSLLKLGPWAGLSVLPAGATERCEGGVCLDVSDRVARTPDRAYEAGLTVTLAVGEAL